MNPELLVQHRCPTYPARPVNGGDLTKAAPKVGHWLYEGKVNGWRALVHAPSHTMFNRHGGRLSIAGEFRSVLGQLGEISRKTDFIWFDCEALERRHDLGRGSLIVLDYVPLQTQSNFTQRKANLHQWIERELLTGFIDRDRLYVLPEFGDSKALEVWSILQEQNAHLGVPFWEGMVAKRADSIYPIQLRSAKEEFPFWVKHRWPF